MTIFAYHLGDGGKNLHEMENISSTTNMKKKLAFFYDQIVETVNHVHIQAVPYTLALAQRSPLRKALAQSPSSWAPSEADFNFQMEN